MKTHSVQILKMILGFFGGLALLALFAFSGELDLQLQPMERVTILGAAIASFGISVHGAWKTPVGGGP